MSTQSGGGCSKHVLVVLIAGESGLGSDSGCLKWDLMTLAILLVSMMRAAVAHGGGAIERSGGGVQTHGGAS